MKASLALVAALATMLTANAAFGREACGETLSFDVHDGQNMAASYGPAAPGSVPLAALVLLPGGGGALDLDKAGCARALSGNTLTRNVAALRTAGFATLLVDAPSDQQGEDGLAGFRANADHARDLGLVIANLRARTGLPVFVVGSSRGTISAVNAAARLSGSAAPDGTILLSPITAGRSGGKKDWVAQTVFDVPLGDIRTPILVAAHESDRCVRTPPQKAREIVSRTESDREETFMASGGPEAGTKVSGVEACQGRYPHGFGGQDDLVVRLITDFIRKTLP